MSEQNKAGGPSKLAADLILGSDGELSTEIDSARAPGGDVPLDPDAFAAPRGDSDPGLPTERIDLEAPLDRALQDPAEAPRRLSIPPAADTLPTAAPAMEFPSLPQPAAWGVPTSARPSAPDVPSPEDTSWPSLPAPAAHASGPSPAAHPAGPARARRVPLPTGLSPEAGGSQEYSSLAAHGIHALPIDEASATAERTIRLPCSLLVAAPDLRVAAQTAAKLMERGYTCRVVDVDGVVAALDQQAFDAAVLEVAVGQAQRDGGAGALAPLERFDGPTIVLCGIPLAVDTIDTRASIASVIEKPFEMEQLVIAIEEAREDAAIAKDDVISRGRFDLGVNLVRAQVTLGELVTRGRIRAMSYDGEVVLDTKEPVALGTKVSARFKTQAGREVEIAGRVVGVDGGTSTLQLKVQELDVDPLRQFVDEARDITTPSVAQVVVRAAPAPPRGDSLGDNRSLQEHWTTVRDRLDDDEAHQVFIKSCLEAKQIEFAVRCYRELKEANPGDERIQKYLNQVGTILGFYAFRNKDVVEDEGGMPTMWKVGLGLFVLMVFILWVVGTLIS